MTTYVLSLSGDEAKAAHARHWAKVRRAKLVCVSRRAGERLAAGRDVPAACARPSADREAGDRASGTRDPQALAALLLRTLDVQDGSGVVLADFDNEAFAADVVERMAALGREVRVTGQGARLALAARLRAGFSRW